VPKRSTYGLRIAKRKKRRTDGPIQPHLVLPKESHEADEDPLMQQYVKIGDTALRNSFDLEEEEDAA
jgi:hypothetical protein